MIVGLSDGRLEVRQTDGEPFPDFQHIIFLSQESPRRAAGVRTGTYNPQAGVPQGGTRVKITWFEKEQYHWRTSWTYVDQD